MASSGGGSADVQIRLTLIRDGKNKVVTVRSSTTAYQDCTHFNDVLRLLFSNNIPEWIASAYQTSTLYLFSEPPHNPESKGGDPQNLQEHKNYKGVWWNTTDKADITTLKPPLSKPGETPLYLAKVCRHCSQNSTLFVLKRPKFFVRGYCQRQACEQAAAPETAAAATAPSWGKFLLLPLFFFSSFLPCIYVPRRQTSLVNHAHNLTYPTQVSSENG